MSIRLGLLSDVHAAPSPVAEALAIFAHEGVSHILCGGDIAGYGDALDETVVLLRQGGVRGVLGNHDQWYLGQASGVASVETRSYLASLPLARSLFLEGQFIYQVHASPPIATMGGIRLLDVEGRLMPDRIMQWTARLAPFGFNVLLVGHTHQIYAERLGNTLVINPGSTLFNHCCAVLTLPEGRLEWFGLSGYEPVSTWNWGASPMMAVPRSN